MTKKLVLSVLLALGMAGIVWADSIPTVMDNATRGVWTQTVYNDSGSDLTSGSVVTWDKDDTEWDRTGYRYITTTTTADDPMVAGVTISDTCSAGNMCEIVVYGPAITRCALNTDGTVAEDTLVGTTTVAGQCGDYSAVSGAAMNGYLGIVMEVYDPRAPGVPHTTADNQNVTVFVNPGWNEDDS